MNFAASAVFIVATLFVAVLLATTSTLVAFAFVLPAALVVLFVAISASEQENRVHHREDNWRHW
jgi:cytochrome c oxidase subunit IV